MQKKLVFQSNWYTSGFDSIEKNRKEIYELERLNYYEKWTGKIGLMYPSDYLYANSECYFYEKSCEDNNWLFNQDNQWVISPYLSHVGFNWAINSSGELNSNYGVNNEFGVRPNIYLNSNVYVTGDGTITSPYQFNL